MTSNTNAKCKRSYRGVVPLPQPLQVSRVLDVDEAVPKCGQAVRAPSRGRFIIRSETFAIAAVADCDIDRRIRSDAALENWMRPFVRVHVAGKHEVDFCVVKQAFHGSTHLHFFSLVVVRFVAVVPRRVQHGN